MNESVSVEIPIGEFELSLLPEDARKPDSEAFRDGVMTFFRHELQQTAGRVQVVVDGQVIRVAWRIKAGHDPLQLAMDRLEDGDHLRGVQMLRLALRLRPGDAKVRYKLGKTLSDLGQLDEALYHLRLAAKAVPDVAYVQLALGRALYYKGLELIRETKPVLETAVRLEPDNPYALLRLACSLLRLSETMARAEELLRMVTTLLPDDNLTSFELWKFLEAQKEAWFELFKLREAQGKDAEADQILDQILRAECHIQLSEIATRDWFQIAQKTMRAAVGGGVKPDAVNFCLEALAMCDGMSWEEVAKIASEIATVGAKGIDPNDPKRKYQLRTLPGEFSGLQLLCYLYVTWKNLVPRMNAGFALRKEYEAALGLFKSKQI